MDESYDRPVSRDDLLFTVEMALRKASRFWPKKRVPGDHDRLRPVAAAVVAHLELCGMRCFSGGLRRPATARPIRMGGRGGTLGTMARTAKKGDKRAAGSQSRPRSRKLSEPVGVTMTWSSSVTSIVFRASRMRPVMSISARDGSGSPVG